MNGEKWGTGIPFSDEDLKMYRARELAKKIEDCYKHYDVRIKIRKKGYNPCCGDGFKFEVKLKDGTRVEKIEGLTRTIGVALQLPNLQLVTENATLYLTTFTPLTASLNNSLQRVVESEEYKSAFEKMRIAHPVGVDIYGEALISDLVEYPHALVSGTTRSGKSTALKCLLVSLLQYTPDEVNLLVADRGAELSRFNGLPHLSYPIIYMPEDLACVSLLLKDEMERRNVLRREDEPSFSKLPYIVCVIDEFPWFIDEISTNRRTEKVVKIINDILRYGRNAKIHLVLSIHDPKSDIAIIEKGDIPVGLVFQTVNARKSMNVFGGAGAEKLSGEGEMYFYRGGKQYHLKGVYMDDGEIDLEVRNIKLAFFNSEFPRGEYGFSISDVDLEKKKEEIADHISVSISGKDIDTNAEERERKFVDVTRWVLSQRSVSVNLIRNNCSVGDKYAQGFFEKLQSYGVIGGAAEKGRREVCPQSIEEIPNELREILSRNDVSDDEIAIAISKRME